jgi:hypothetical protein
MNNKTKTIECPSFFLCNADLPFPPEAAPFCPNVTTEWLEKEGYDAGEFTLYKGVAFKKSLLLTGFVYEGELCLAYDSWGKRWFTKEYIDRATDLRRVTAEWEEHGYVPNHGVGHRHARRNFLGHTLSLYWAHEASYGTLLARRQAWWDALPLSLKVKSI